MQEHFCKRFKSVNRVKFQDGTHQIEGMTDMMKEYVPFKDAITAGPLEEAWLAQIE